MRFLADENFDNDILRAVMLESGDLDIVRVQDTEFYSAADPAVLAWAAETGRILLTHDIKTIPGFAYDRVRAGLPMPGVIAVHRLTPMKEAIDALLTVIGASDPEEWRNKVTFLPLR